MRKILRERRELTKQYYELKVKLDQLDEKKRGAQKEVKKPPSTMQKEKIKQTDHFFCKDKTAHYNSFDRVSKNIVLILKHSDVPLSNKQILKKLNEEYEISTSLKNLTCNILPKMKNERSLPIQKAYRGYWQYKMFSKEGNHV